MKKPKRIHNDTYKVTIQFFKDFTREEVVEYMKSRDEVISESFTSGVVGKAFGWREEYGSFRFGIWMEDINDLGVLCHESFHLINFILRERNIELTDSSDEAYAYLLEWLVNKLLRYPLTD